jgi:protein tyrosine phosphatase
VTEALTGIKGSRLSLEYKTVPHNSVKSLPLSSEEKRKNRYRNVLPNPDSAVRLSDTGVAGSQYINANYIHGYGDKEGQYIATQGPTGNTLADFWRMVWEKDVSIIVMTTSLVENGTQKCVKYWPGADDMDTVAYGNMVVRNNYEEVTESYTTSYLSIYPQSPDGREMGEERDVYHFWHTAWCDFGVPRETGSTLRLREAVDAFRAPTSGPVLVHCRSVATYA